MKDKIKLFWGHVYLSKGLYNLLYNLFCVVVIAIMILNTAFTALYFQESEYTLYMSLGNAIVTVFVAVKIFDKSNYV
ncbi:hypothetical protein KKH23_07285 [Patescibacteria group bacterium]|nr:hypothetical protein [Patescibacteria group bacterium]